MFRILVVKTSSLGDVVHMLPALTDAARARPGLRADWVVEEGFAAVPAWHPAVSDVFGVALRRWRRRPWAPAVRAEVRALKRTLRKGTYDFVVDAQGLYKSALLARWGRGERVGYDRSSAREPLAALAYDRTVTVPRAMHAIERNRRLLAGALGYESTAFPLDYGLTGLRERLDSPPPGLPEAFVLGLHGTSRPDPWVASAVNRCHQTP